ncbi:MAG: GNAT family N-acetyltransferase [Thermodesulfobacteriota bacterium]
MDSKGAGINERFKRARIGLKDTLAVIDMTLEEQLRELVALSPNEVFDGLNELIGRTVRGTKIERFKPQEDTQPFHTFEIHTEGGEVLGYLNMIYLRKPIPCYYLVYVEVLFPFRGRGLGHKILKAFREFVEDKGAVGLLDNIIPPEEPTYDIYTKLGWQCIEGLIGDGMVNGGEHYMVFVPTSIKTPDLRDKLIKLLFNLRKKRSVIDMHDNESMVKRTIAEFRSVYEALESLFDMELSTATSTPFMRFLFTKFVTKVLGFRRRIATLLGYTGGESLEQISISDRIKALPIQPYSLWGSKEGQAEIWGEEGIIRDLPEGLKEQPTLYIEGLPLYRRPYLYSWMERKGGGRSLDLRISDLLELGFDPTKLREFRHEGLEYIFERISPRFLSSVEKKRRFLPKIAKYASRRHFRNASIQINPPIAILRDRGNVYILRRKVEGIHLEEALDQLRTSSYLKNMNRAVGIDRAVVMTINEIKELLVKGFDSSLREEIEDLTFFVPWDLERNIPKVTVDSAGVSLDTMWIA